MMIVRPGKYWSAASAIRPRFGADDRRAGRGLEVGAGVLTARLAVEDGSPAEAARGGARHRDDEGRASRSVRASGARRWLRPHYVRTSIRGQFAGGRIDEFGLDRDPPRRERSRRDRDRISTLQRPPVSCRRAERQRLTIRPLPPRQSARGPANVPAPLDKREPSGSATRPGGRAALPRLRTSTSTTSPGATARAR